MRRWVLSCVGVAAFATALHVQATHVTQELSDMSSGDALYDAVEFLREEEIIHGYPDGTFRADQPVNRAEALKIIVGPLTNIEDLCEVQCGFLDAPLGAWYVPYIMYAHDTLSIIDGPEVTGMFHPSRTVNKAEFLKMMLLRHKAELNRYDDIESPIGFDVSDDEWFYTYMRYALAHSIIDNDTRGNLYPAQDITRGEAALLLYRFLNKDEHANDLLNSLENDINVVLGSLSAKDTNQAKIAALRAVLKARGAFEIRPEEPLTQSTVKIAEAYRHLARAYEFGLQQAFEPAENYAQRAWARADDAAEIYEEMKTAADQVKDLASGIADNARRGMGK